MLKGATWDQVTTRGLVIRDFPGGPELVLIPAGSFVMGIPPEESEREDTTNTTTMRGRSRRGEHRAGRSTSAAIR